MNVFEDLVVELKEQNLLEETVIDLAGENVSGGSSAASVLDEEPIVFDDGISGFDFALPETMDPAPVEAPALQHRPLKPENVRRRIGDQMGALQMVEHIFNAVEREFMRIKPNAFDELPVRKAFHRYEQASAAPDSNEYFEAESSVLNELEAWENTLTARDKEIPAACIRRYSETAQPPLSPQALFALARFYHASEFSELVRTKFDFVVTRLFSKFVDVDRRELLCPRDEIVRHLKQRYSDWTAAAVYPAMADDPDVMLLVLTLEDFIVEAESASDLGELVSSGLFERICRFKESTGETFLYPHVTAAAVECNIRVATKVIDLIAAELEISDTGTILSKYIALDDRVLSEAVGRTLSLEGLVDAQDGSIENDLPDQDDVANEEPAKDVRPPYRRTSTMARRRAADRRFDGINSLLGINRWMLLATVMTIVASVGVYVWAEYFAGEVVTSVGVKSVDLGDESLKPFIKTSKLSGDMLYAMVSPSFDKLSQSEQEDLLRRIWSAGTERGYRRVSLLNMQGRAIGYASAERLTISSP